MTKLKYPSEPRLAADDDSLMVTIASGATITATIDESTLSTSAKQDTGNTSIASLDTKQPAKGTAAMAGSSPVTMATDDTLLTAFAAKFPTLASAVVAVTSTLTGMVNALPWAVFHTTPSTRTNTQGGPLEADSAGNLRCAEQLAPGYEDNTANKAVVEHRYTVAYISTAGTTTVKSGAGALHLVTINKHVAASAITFYDSTTGSGTVIALITPGAALLTDPPITAFYDITFSTGLTVVTAGASNLSVSFR